MSVIQLDEYRLTVSPEQKAVSETYATEREADLALQLADAESRIAELELALVETLKRNALNWARAQEAETELSALKTG
ncbi:MAG: hypothetical protein AAF908_03175 [Pseudomonadota bacterium]